MASSSRKLEAEEDNFMPSRKLTSDRSNSWGLSALNSFVCK